VRFSCPSCGRVVEIDDIAGARKHLSACNPAVKTATTESVTLPVTLPVTYRATLEIPSQNQYARRHWSQAAREAKDWRTLVSVLMRELSGLSLPYSVWHFTRLVPKRGRFYDHANLVGGCKGLVDALTDNRIIQDDNIKCFSASYSQVRYADHAEGIDLERDHILTLITLLDIHADAKATR